VDAVFEYLVFEGETVGDAEVEVFEEAGDAGEEADALDVARVGLTQKLADELAAGSAALDVGADGNGADLGKVRTIDVKGGAAEELVGVRFDDGEGADVGADLRIGAPEEGSVVGEAVDELVDGVGVLELSFTRSEEDELGPVA